MTVTKMLIIPCLLIFQGAMKPPGGPLASIAHPARMREQGQDNGNTKAKPRVYPKELKQTQTKRWANIYSDFIHNCQNLDTTKKPFGQ